ncbi:MAG TPA: hypothetical protein ENK83_02425 [Aliiroseovarius sp.]|nr:hypothetical protein [Aliiroseovarius sp.]
MFHNSAYMISFCGSGALAAALRALPKASAAMASGVISARLSRQIVPSSPGTFKSSTSYLVRRDRVSRYMASLWLVVGAIFWASVNNCTDQCSSSSRVATIAVLNSRLASTLPFKACARNFSSFLIAPARACARLSSL